MSKTTVTAIEKRLDEFLPKRIHNPTDIPAVVIDGMGLAYAAYASYSKLSFKGSSTAMIFGVPQMIKTILKRYPTDRLIVCWDGDRNKKRLEILPGYKGHRDKKRDPNERKKFLADIEKLKKILHRLGIAQAYDKEVEGDDMVYFVAQNTVKTHRVVIVSSDKDMHQLINFDISVYNPRTNEIFTPFAFKGTYPIELPQFVDYLCLTGDKSDDIPNYSGFGPETASKFFDKYYRVKDYLKSKAVFAGLADKKEVEILYKRNRKLIDLPYFCKRYYPENYQVKFYRDNQFPNYNPEKYRSLCLKFNLKTMLYPEFIKCFTQC